MPPFTPHGTAESTLTISLQVEAVIGDDPITFHTCDPVVLAGIITHKPPVPDDSLIGPDAVTLCDEQGQPTDHRLGPFTFVPSAAGQLLLQTYPPRVRAGGTIAFTGQGFTPRGSVTKTFIRPDGSQFSFQTEADGQGVVTGALNIPPNEQRGIWHVIARDETTGRTVETTFQVTGRGRGRATGP